MTKYEKLLDEYKTSTGSFQFAELCEQLLNLEGQKKVLEDAIAILRNSIKESGKLPYTSKKGKINLEVRGVYVQNVKALFQQLPEKVFFRAASISKTQLSDDKEEAKKYAAIVELNTKKVGETKSIKVTLTKKETRVKEEKVKVK